MTAEWSVTLASPLLPPLCCPKEIFWKLRSIRWVHDNIWTRLPPPSSSVTEDRTRTCGRTDMQSLRLPAGQSSDGCTLNAASLGTSFRYLPLPLPRAIIDLGVPDGQQLPKFLAFFFAPLPPFSYWDEQCLVYFSSPVSPKFCVRPRRCHPAPQLSELRTVLSSCHRN